MRTIQNLILPFVVAACTVPAGVPGADSDRSSAREAIGEKVEVDREERKPTLVGWGYEERAAEEASDDAEVEDDEREARLRGGRDEKAYQFMPWETDTLWIAWEDAKHPEVRIKFREVGARKWKTSPDPDIADNYLYYGDILYMDPADCAAAGVTAEDCEHWWGEVGITDVEPCTEYEVKVQYQQVIWHRVDEVFTASTACPPPCEPVVDSCGPSDCGTIWNGCPGGLWCGPCDCDPDECWCTADDQCSDGGACPNGTLCPL